MTSFYEELRKNDSISDEKENEQSRKNVDKWIFGLLLFLIGFMPLVILANVEEVVSPLVSSLEILSSGMKGELFTHYKALLVLMVTIITGIMLLAKIVFMGGTIRKTKMNYVIGVFVIAIVVSTLASPNITIALGGQHNRSDGAISWLCYVALMFIAMNIEYPKNIVRYIMYTMMPFVYINLYIINRYFYWRDLMGEPWVQKLVSITLPEGATISEGSVLVGTLNQWNYMSGMFAMITIMYLAWAVTSTKWHEVIIGAITASAAVIVMFMAISTSGFLAFSVALIFVIIFVLRTKNKVKALVAMLICLILVVPTFNKLAEIDIKVWNESFGFFIKSNPYADNISMNFEKNNLVYASDQVIEIPELPESGWSLGTGRLYIWEKTADLIKERLILGYGADSLIYNFPHFNIDARSGLADEKTITDKAHNGYVSTLYNFGLIAIIAFLVITVLALKTVLSSIISKSVPIFILSSITIAYFIQNLFNDSLPAITAFVFVIMGIMFSLLDSSNRKDEISGR
ncbi:MAG: O-antigen ligase family protein [Solibacillus sp.]